MSKTIRKTKWYSFQVCEKCTNRLTESELMNSNGTCPYCGNTSWGTICEYKKVTLRALKEHFGPLGLFSRVIGYEAADKISEEYLNKNK